MVVRELYVVRISQLEKQRDELFERLHRLERRYNMWPLPLTRPAIILMLQFDYHSNVSYRT